MNSVRITRFLLHCIESLNIPKEFPKSDVHADYIKVHRHLLAKFLRVVVDPVVVPELPLLVYPGVLHSRDDDSAGQRHQAQLREERTGQSRGPDS